MEKANCLHDDDHDFHLLRHGTLNNIHNNDMIIISIQRQYLDAVNVDTILSLNAYTLLYTKLIQNSQKGNNDGKLFDSFSLATAYTSR